MKINFETFEKVFNNHSTKNNWEWRTNDDTNYFSVEVETGGSTGGSCWGSESHPYTIKSDIDKEDSEQLDSLLAELFPNITFIQYRNLAKKISWNKTSYTNNEYYGNYTSYVVKYITVRELWNAFVESNLVEDDD